MNTKNLNFFAWSLIICGLAGCGVQTHSENNGAYIMAWDSNLSAAVAPPANQKMCMQLALTSVDKKSNTNVSITDAIGNVIYKLPSGNTGNAEDIIKYSNDLLKTSKSLNVSTEKTAFLLAGGFYICQFQMNGMDSKDVKALASEWLRLSSSLATTKEEKFDAEGNKTTTTTTSTTGNPAVESAGSVPGVPSVPSIPSIPSVSAAVGTGVSAAQGTGAPN